MGEVVEYSRRDANVRGDTSSGCGGGGGAMLDDILKRLAAVEQGLSELRAQVSAILAVIPHLVTKADLEGVRGEVQGVRTEVQGVRTEVQGVRTEVQGVRTEVASMQATLIKWYVATSLTVAGLAFAAARFIH